jgi:hypothetical protein
MPKRLPGYDYSQPGFYFVTICTLHHRLVFCTIVDGQVIEEPRADCRIGAGHLAQTVIRSEASLQQIRQYILENPLRWTQDEWYQQY